MTRLLTSRLAVLVLGLLPALAVAQPTPPGGGGGITPVPVDGGLGLLALAGAAYAVRRLRDR